MKAQCLRALSLQTKKNEMLKNMMVFENGRRVKASCKISHKHVKKMITKKSKSKEFLF
jgi:hypothetical protein